MSTHYRIPHASAFKPVYHQKSNIPYCFLWQSSFYFVTFHRFSLLIKGRQFAFLWVFVQCTVAAVAVTPKTWTLTVLMLQYEVLCFMYRKGCNMCLFKFIFTEHTIKGPLSEMGNPQMHSPEVWNTPVWYKEISYGNLVGDSIVSYGQQRKHE